MNFALGKKKNSGNFLGMYGERVSGFYRQLL